MPNSSIQITIKKPQQKKIQAAEQSLYHKEKPDASLSSRERRLAKTVSV
jgi:hypothetical protein